MTEDKKKHNNIGVWIGIAIVGVAVAVFLFLFFNGSESYTPNVEQSSKINSLDCVSSDLKESFYDVKGAQRATHEIRVTYKDDKLKDISYIMEATYSSPEAAESASAEFHARYNIYMGENNRNINLLNPVFLPQKSKAKATIYGNNEKLDDVTATLFYIPKDDLANVKKSGHSRLEKIYETRGFTCTYRD